MTMRTQPFQKFLVLFAPVLLAGCGEGNHLLQLIEQILPPFLLVALLCGLVLYARKVVRRRRTAGP